jgi:hypothetical protein
MEMGNPGDTRSGGQGILEIRVDHGPVPDLPCASRCAGCNSVVWGTSARNGGTSNGLRSWRRHCDSASICPKLLIRTRPQNHHYTRRILTSSAPPTCRNLHSPFLPHRVPAAPRAHDLSTRFRAVALFGRRSPERVVRSSSPAAENLAQ